MAEDRNRPYIRFSIVQLEEVFEAHRSDLAILAALTRELNKRKTPRAARLLSRVTDASRSAPTEERDTDPEQILFLTERASRPAVPPLNEDHFSHEETRVASPIGQEVPVPEMGDSPSIPTPQSSNEPSAILAAWTALEALSPQTYCLPEDLSAGDRSCLVDLKNIPLPWQRGERSRPKKQLYYQIILGSISMSKAAEELIKAFGQDEEHSNPDQKKAPIAAILIDRHGVPLEINGVSISSFAWALPLALQLKLESLGAWAILERGLKDNLNHLVRRVGNDGELLPIDFPTIQKAYLWLLERFGLAHNVVEPPTFALRVYHYYQAKNPPEALLLNSFFIGDLARASSLVSKGKAPAGLRLYLGIDKPSHITELLKREGIDEECLEQAVAPALMPMVRWPSPGGHPLVLLQQAAVNLIRLELAEGEGLIAVNGPPGTGKTTLLRDLVAACVLDRALAMAAFDDPETAFTPSGVKFAAGTNAFFHLYSLSQSLKGHEVLVASSNNKAVENVSRELPAAKAVGRAFSELSYFRSIADFVQNSGPFGDEEDKDQADTIETWGLIAAVLGNAGNRFNFQQSFWWNDDRSLRLYLKAAKGDSVVREIKDIKTGKVIERRTPSVILAEKPPLPQVSRSNWSRAKEKLLKLKREVESEVKMIDKVRQLCRRLPSAQIELSEGEANLASLLTLHSQAQENKLQLVMHLRTAEEACAYCQRNITNHLAIRPSFFSRLFQTSAWKEWRQAHASLLDIGLHADATLQTNKKMLAEAISSFEDLVIKVRHEEESVESLRRKVSAISQEIESKRGVLDDRLVDSTFFSKGHDAANLASPWLPDKLHRKREDLFIAALDVHRAFIDASAQKVLHNLSILMDVLVGGPPQDETKRKLLGELWSTLFMVIPVLSTTFASVERMLGELPPCSLGWLLIDEAGQALPQAAVGVVMRARRTIIVGDPLQIPPVVSLPERLNIEICKFFKTDKQIWSAPEASVQTLADRASSFQAAFAANEGERRVGIPLLVHRRCQEPMFGISNRIAYGGKMVYAPIIREAGKIGSAIGPSCWFDIDGEAVSKWCPAEGEYVVSLMKQIAGAGITNPDLFIITPFRVIAQELRRRLKRETELFSRMGVDAYKWGMDRIGTIHTVQGREAESVILVLGTPRQDQHGARCWAAGIPNILNVAVSRAKQSFYVIGSYGAWAGIGYAREIAELERRRVLV